MKCETHNSEDVDPELGLCPLCILRDGKAEEAGEGEEADADADTDGPPEDDAVTGDGQSNATDDGKGGSVIPLASVAPEPPEQNATPDAATDKDEDEAAIAAFFFKLQVAIKDGHFPILFLGFPTAGKTWLLHRMKEQLFTVDSVICVPEFKGVEAPRGQRQPLKATNEITLHTAMAQKRSFVLIDIPGEMTNLLINHDFGALRMLLGAMYHCRAMIVALPADILLYGPEFPDDDASVLELARDPDGGKIDEKALRAWAARFREDHDRLEAFTYGVFRVAGILSYLKTHNINPANADQYSQVTNELVDAYIARTRDFPVGGKDGLDCPTFFALTKADGVLAFLGEPDGTDPKFLLRNQEILKRPTTRVLDALAERMRHREELPTLDPWQVVRTVRRSLHTQLVRHFPMAKFDYVTAFYGHDGENTLAKDHYERHPQDGVYEVLQWIAKAQRLGKSLSVYAQAARVRRYVAGIRTGGLDFGDGKKRS